MKPASREKRRDEILETAVDVLVERGYRDTSMLEIAKRAGASKETLYNWFSDKPGLFEAVIRRNAETVQQVLAQHLEDDAPVEIVLADFGRALLELLLGDPAVAINRAAVSEAQSDPRLAEILIESGRESTLPVFVEYLRLQSRQGVVRIAVPSRAAEDFLGLLIGDMQIRRLLGILAQPSNAQIRIRAARAAKNFLRLYAP